MVFDYILFLTPSKSLGEQFPKVSLMKTHKIAIHIEVLSASAPASFPKIAGNSYPKYQKRFTQAKKKGLADINEANL